MSVTVYDHPLSPYGQKVKIALLEKGVDFVAPLPVELGSGAADGEFAAASPRGEVPALIDGEVTVFDSSVILQYIEERWPEPPLLPPTPAERARVRMLEDAMDTHFEAITWGIAEIIHFGRAPGALGDAMLGRAAKQLAQWYEWLEIELSERTWFNGGEFGWGDLVVAPFVIAAVRFGHQPEADSGLSNWIDIVSARPSVKACADAAAAMAFDSPDVNLDAVKLAMDQGLFKREYRDHRLEWMVKTGGLAVVDDGIAKDNVRFIEPFAAGQESGGVD
ncbi:MAG: glutathione S-transferase family protein [Gammaproteobacteria bacterium]|nr:glutathione S-transferase family protein [Gammaproteobacteria bacterium]